MPDATAREAAPSTLYRRHRPTRFADLVGQEHVSTALRNAVREGRTGHAYLFSGPRGTGKTTTARILARALNCLALTDEGEPCGTCDNCTSIAAGEFYDLVELDAASNRGIDAIRDLIQGVSLGLGASALRKVYVIDEVHMLTPEASSALLKTLEEPPAHVVFVLATTDPSKVLPTIRSRTQHFEFGLLDHDQMLALLHHVLDVEGVAAEPDALELIGRRAAGSARDALSLLDQALALGEGALDVERARHAFGDTALGVRLAVLDGIAAEDPALTLEAVTHALSAGIDPRRLVDDLLRTARDAFVVSASNGRVAPPETAPEDVEQLTEIAERLGPAGLTRAIDAFGQAIVDVRSPAAPDPRLVVEVAAVRLARRESRAVVDTLLDRVERLEREVAALRERGLPAEPATPTAGAADPPSAPGGTGPAPKPALGALAAQAGGRERPASSVPPDDAPEAPPEVARDAPTVAVTGALDLDDVISAWPRVLDSLSTPVRSQVDLAQPVAVEHDVIVFGAPSVHVRRVNAKFRENADAIRGALTATLGCTPKLKVVTDEMFADLGGSRARAGGSASAAGAEPEPEEPPPDHAVDLGDLVDAPLDDTPVDSTSRLMETFDATVVDERPRG